MLAHRFGQPQYLFATIALVFGIIFANLIPPVWGIDEPAHFSRAYQISRGRPFERKLDTGGYGGWLPVELVTLNTYAIKDLVNNRATDRSEVDDANYYAHIKDERLSGKLATQDFTGAGVYSPFSYLAPAVGIVAARIIHPTVGTVLLWARLGGLLAYIALVFGALYLLREHPAKWLVFTISLLPMSVFQASIVTVDSVAIGMAALFFAELITLWSQKGQATRLQLLALTATGVLLTLTKPNFFLLTLPAVFLPARVLSMAQKRFVRVLMPVITLIPAVAWNIFIHDLVTTGARIQRAGNPKIRLDFLGQLIHIVTHPLSYLTTLWNSVITQSWYEQTFGLLGFNYVALPAIVVGLLSMVLAVAIVVTTKPDNPKEAGPKGQALILLAAALGAALSIVTALYLAFNTVGGPWIEGVQGRYFLPVLPFMLYGLSQLLPLRAEAGEGFARAFFSGSLAVALAFSVYWYWIVTY